MDFGLLCIVFCAGFAAGLVGGEIMDRHDVLYHCPRCKRRDEEIVEKCQAKVNALLSGPEATSRTEESMEYCRQCCSWRPLYKRILKDAAVTNCSVCHSEIAYFPHDRY